MSKQLQLLKVEKDSPSRREKLKAFMALYQIETHYAGKGWPKDEGPWMAMLMPAARKMGYGATETSTLFDVMMKVGRLTDEAEISVYGSTEREAVERLAEIHELRPKTIDG